MPLSSLPFLLEWPRALQRDRTLQWELIGRTISGGKTLSGAMPLARMDGGGLWACEMGDVQVSTADHVRMWRALASALDGGATPVVLEARDELAAPWPADGSGGTTALNDDGSGPDDGTSYTTAAIQATIVSAAALRATTLMLVISNGAQLQGGELFSIEHDTYSHRLYRIASVRQSSAAATITIRPPLREAVSAETRVEFDYPKCVMQLATPDAMDLPLTRRTFGQARVRFIERLPPFGDGEVVVPLPEHTYVRGTADFTSAFGSGLIAALLI